MNIKINFITNIPGPTIDYLVVELANGKQCQVSWEKSEYKQMPNGKHYTATLSNVTLGFDIKTCKWIYGTGKIQELNNCTIKDIVLYRQMDTNGADEIFLITDIMIEDENSVNAACYNVNVGKFSINGKEKMFKIDENIEEEPVKLLYDLFKYKIRNIGYQVYYELELPYFNIN